MKKSKLCLLWICASLFAFAGCGDDSGNSNTDSPETPEIPETPVTPETPETPEKLCGNGIVEDGEVCDDGNKNDKDGCTAKCKWSFDDFKRVDSSDGMEIWRSESGKVECTIDKKHKMTCKSMFCGDGKLNDGEECDSKTFSVYGVDEDGNPLCDATCHFVHYCGDKLVDSEHGEECDNGDANENGVYGGCTKECKLGPHCGDDVLDPDNEICEIGSEGDNEGCLNCTEIKEGYECSDPYWCELLTCSNGVLDPGELCDDGNNDPGDGCHECKIEDGYKCQHQVEKNVMDENGVLKPITVNACTECEGLNVACMKIVYGDGVLDIDGYEECDDGNLIDNDGCTVGKIDPGYECKEPGRRCKAKSCSDGIMAYGEECDDGNSFDGDGCSSRCTLEEGFRCTTVKNGLTTCDTPKGYCGDGIVQTGETCDDGNNIDGDGCSAACAIEQNFKCPVNPGGACEDANDLCGNGTVDKDTDYKIWEECDLGKDESGNSKNVAGSGCNQCRVEQGYHCGIIENTYQCVAGKCRDGYRDVGEECDDGNKVPNDGCSPSCKRELMFTEYTDEDGVVTYSPKCGDGITLWMIPRRDSTGKAMCKTEANKDKAAPYTTEKDLKDHYQCEFGFVPAEECDDGNLIGNDGCSKQCEIETGFTCTDFRDMASAPTIDLDITYYDFRNPKSNSTTAAEPASWDATNEPNGGFMTQSLYNDILAYDPSCKNRSTFTGSISGSTRKGYPDFGCNYGGSGCGGMVENYLDEDGKMVLVSNWASKNCTIRSTGTKINSHVSCAGTFRYWYRYVPGVNIQIDSKLRMTQDSNDPDCYRFHATDWGPIANMGYHSATASPRADSEGNFTSQLHTYFQYKGGEKLEFRGNDDVWAFINKRLFVDLGGMQGENYDYGVLSNELCELDGEVLDTKCDKTFDIYENGIYELHFFQAERCWPGSTYQLTLDGFLNTGKSECSALCGDGIVSVGEECDNGDKNNDDLYDGCTTHCTFGPHCGDGQVTHNEQCDDGNLINGDGCSANCKNELN